MKTFVEIGSCDFNHLNHFADQGWKGVIVEPVKKYLDRIPVKDNVSYLNYAVDTTHGKRNLYLFSDNQVANDHDFAGMSTFYEQENTIPLEVETITYQEVVDMAGLEQVDYLKIDTEGHDWDILQNVIFEGPLRPTWIRVEHKHCPVDEMIDFLEKMNYTIYHLREDLVCTCNYWLDSHIPRAKK